MKNNMILYFLGKNSNGKDVQRPEVGQYEVYIDEFEKLSLPVLENVGLKNYYNLLVITVCLFILD